MKVMYTERETIDLIKQGKILVLAGDISILKNLPKGKWIGGSIPYFIAETGGLFCKDKIYVSDITDYVKSFEIKIYNKQTINKVNKEAFDDGFSVMLLAGNSETHGYFAVNAPHFEEFGCKQLIGWVTGVDLKDMGTEKPIIVSGEDLIYREDGAVVLHASLKEGYHAGIDIVNVFQPDSNSQDFEFFEDSFIAKEAIIDGKKYNLAKYIKETKLDTTFPILGNYCGTNINISFQTIGEDEVSFFAPVFKGIHYKIARPSGDYVSQLEKEAQGRKGFSLLAFNCLHNYTHGDLEGKNCGAFTAPCTFGEIAYQLLNRTLVRLIILKA